MNDVRFVRHTAPLTIYSHWKNIQDRLIAAFLLLPGLPIILILWAVVRASSRGPGIFRQVRTGKNGKSFIMYKLRTMTVDAEKSGPVWAKIDDPRTTLVGRWLRNTHLDELPQLFNVLKGEMALVGPRPERPEFVEVLAKQIPGYRRRLDVLPGITGLAQVNLPPDDGIESVKGKLFLDRTYIESVSFSFDLRLVCCTAAKLVGFDGQWAVETLNLKRSPPNHQLTTDKESSGQFIQPAEISDSIPDSNGHLPINQDRADSTATLLRKEKLKMKGKQEFEFRRINKPR